MGKQRGMKMNLKGKLTATSTLNANTSVPTVIRTGGATSWNDLQGKPFSEVDTESGLKIYDDTLMIDTLDTIATIDYVDSHIPDISDLATKSELDAVEAEIPSLTGYATEQYVDTAISNIPDPEWDDIQNKPTFATVATSGSYNDLSNKPTIPSIDGLATEQYVDDAIADIQDPEWDDIQNKPTFATVATSGSYNDLSNKSTIPTVPTNVSAFTNDAGYITNSALTPYVQASSLTTVAYSGDYNDLDNLPTIPQPTSVTVTQTLSTGTAIADIDVNGVTTTLYAPAGGGSSVQADWAETDSTADSYIQNKPPIINGSNNKGIILSTNSNYKVSTGTGSIASGIVANSAFSDSILATGIGATAFGNIQGGSQQINASGVASTAKGQTNRSCKITASGIGSVAIGNAEFYSITASGQGSLAIGYTDDGTVSREIKATAANSFAFGAGAQATKGNSFAFGRYASADSLNQMAVGKYNVVDSSRKYNFIVGNGASSSALSNSFATGADGNIFTAGDIYTNVSDWSNPTTSGTKLANIPAPPTTDGTYTLQAVVSNGTITYSWI